MSKLICLEEEKLSHLSNILDYLYGYYGDVNIELYAFLTEENKMGFIAFNGGKGLYIIDDGEIKTTPFERDEEGLLQFVKRDGYTITFSGDDTFMYEYATGIEHYLTINKLDEVDFEGYNGSVNYIQYSAKNKKKCQINYQQMYVARDGIVPIYECHLTKKDKVFIDYGVEERDGETLDGVVDLYEIGKRNENFIRIDAWQSITAIFIDNYRRYGLKKALEECRLYLDDWVGNFKSEDRYFNVKLIGGDMYTSFPFAFGKTLGEMDEKINSEGFHTSVPQFVVDIYNERDDIIYDIVSLLEQVKTLTDDKKKILLMVRKEDSNG